MRNMMTTYGYKKYKFKTTNTNIENQKQLKHNIERLKAAIHFKKPKTI